MYPLERVARKSRTHVRLYRYRCSHSSIRYLSSVLRLYNQPNVFCTRSFRDSGALVCGDMEKPHSAWCLVE